MVKSLDLGNRKGGEFVRTGVVFEAQMEAAIARGEVTGKNANSQLIKEGQRLS